MILIPTLSVSLTETLSLTLPALLKGLLQNSGFTFTPQQLAGLVQSADTNHDGVIDLAEFIPIAVAFLKPNSQPSLPSVITTDPAHLQRYLRDLFSIADINGDGILQPSEMRELLQLCGFQMSADQVDGLVAAADINKDGVIQYEEFIPVAMELLQAPTWVSENAASTDIEVGPGDVKAPPPKQVRRPMKRVEV